MEKGSVTLYLSEIDTTITLYQLFSYIKKKSEDKKDMMLLSIRDMEHLSILSEYSGLLEVSGQTVANKKYPEGCFFTCSKCTIIRAEKRMGYCEYLLLCEDKIKEE